MFYAINPSSTNLPKGVLEANSTPLIPSSQFQFDSLGEGLQIPPRNFIPWGVEAGETFEVDEGNDSPRKAEPVILDRWDIQSHQYTTQADVEKSILGRLITAKAEASGYGIVQEAKRFCNKTTADGYRYEMGTAVRLSVAVLSTAFDASLTLPNIAAKAQLTDLRARIALSVDGYVGPLGELLPAPDNLNVENLSLYTTAFKEIQTLVFGEEGKDFISPTVLGYEKTAGSKDAGKPARAKDK